MHVPPGEILPQLLVSVKSPRTCTELMATSEPPSLVKVTLRGTLDVPTDCDAKFSVVGLTETTSGVPAPIPVSVKTWGAPCALSLTVNAPERVPEVVGLKVTLMVQSEAAATEPPQSSLSAKSPAMVSLLMARVAEPMLRNMLV
jgi:hypothetical protein